jgi:hypothetical protein
VTLSKVPVPSGVVLDAVLEALLAAIPAPLRAIPGTLHLHQA